MTAADFLTRRFEEQPDTPAVVSPAARCSFRELVESIRRWTREVDRHGVSPGTVVGLAGEFSPSSLSLFFALADRGTVIVPYRNDTSAGREDRDVIAQVEACFYVDRSDGVRFESTGRTASHPLYDELRERSHPGLVQFSSGTAGEPKAAVHDLSLLLEKFEVRRPARSTLAFLSFDHMGGLNTMLHALSNGAALVSPGDRSPESVCSLIAEHGVELLPATPTFLNLLLLSGAHRRHDLSSLRVISYGAEPMPAATLARLREAFPGVTLQQTYGLIEVGALRTKSRGDGSLWVKVGGEGFQTRVVDGMLELRARSLLLGYLNARTPITADGWFRTGDMVERDGDYLRFLGRDSDLINVGGEKVYPVEVEGVIEELPSVAEATVYGESNGLVGQIVCAKVRPAGRLDDARLVTEVKRFCRARLERYKVPVKVRVVDERQFGDRYKKQRRDG